METLLIFFETMQKPVKKPLTSFLTIEILKGSGGQRITGETFILSTHVWTVSKVFHKIKHDSF